MSTSISLVHIRKKFVLFYSILVILTFSVTAIIYDYFLTSTAQVISNVSHNSVMINDLFALKQNVSPLVTGDVFDVQLFNSVDQVIYSHSTEKKFKLYATHSYSVKTNENVLFTVVIKASLLKISILYLTMILLMLFLYFPFKKYELRQYENQRNESIASLTRKVAHDIRSPISTLSLISHQIPNDEIKKLQMSVVEQINSIAEDLLEKNRILSGQPLGLKNNGQILLVDLFKQIEAEYFAKKVIHKRSIQFLISSNNFLIQKEKTKILYPVVCNFINNSIDATFNDLSIITITVETSAKHIKIIFFDNGKGMPDDIVNKIGQMPISFDKSNGNGLALFNAKKDLESIGGTLKVKSVFNEFTQIEIEIKN